MEIKEIELFRFRNYLREKIPFSPGLNIILGDNAQGKTNIAEAVFLCCVGKSPRTAKDKQLIMWEEENSYVKAAANRRSGTGTVEIYLTKRDNKRIKVNGLPINKMGELLGTIKAVYFSPDELKMVKEGPEYRRRFLDTGLSQLKSSYFYSLKNYHKILKQRNNLLKSAGEHAIRDTVFIWDEQLAKEGARIILDRLEFSGNLREIAAQTHADLTDGAETLELGYDTLAEIKPGFTAAEIKDVLSQKLAANLTKDIRLCYTSVGPHRDDISISANGVDLRQYGSQGQQRTAALTLKLAELELFQRATGEYPVLILDDVLSELDKNRQLKLLNKIQYGQSLLTCTHLDENLLNGKNYTVLKICGGKLIGSESYQIPQN